MDIVHDCSGVTYPYLMKQDFFSLRFFLLLLVCNVVFQFFPFFPREMKTNVRSLNKVCKLTDQCFCLLRFNTRFMYQYGWFMVHLFHTIYIKLI